MRIQTGGMNDGNYITAQTNKDFLTAELSEPNPEVWEA